MSWWWIVAIGALYLVLCLVLWAFFMGSDEDW